MPFDFALNVWLLSEVEAARKISAAGVYSVKPAAVPWGSIFQVGAILGVVH